MYHVLDVNVVSFMCMREPLTYRTKKKAPSVIRIEIEHKHSTKKNLLCICQEEKKIYWVKKKQN